MSSVSLEYKNYLDLIKDPAYLELYEYYSSETTMGILGVDRQENPHSCFIKWLLDINGNHGYGTSPMRKLLETVCLFKEKVYIDPDTKELRKDGLWIEKDNLLNSCNELYLDEIKYGKYEIAKQVITTEQVLFDQRRVDIFSLLKLEVDDANEKKPVYLIIVIENKVHSSEHTDQTKAYADSLKNTAYIEVLKKVADKTGQDWITKELCVSKKNSEKKDENDKAVCLKLFIYLNAVPTRDIKGYLALDNAVLKKRIVPLAQSLEFITLNYQYLLDGVLEPLAMISKGKQKERMYEYIRCLGQARISPSDESRIDKNEEYLIMAVTSREKKLALELWNNGDYREVIYSVLKSYFDKNDEFVLRNRDIVFWGSLANLYRFIGDDLPEDKSLVPSKKELLDLVRIDNGVRIIRTFIYNGKDYISYKHPSLGLLFRDMVKDYLETFDSEVMQREAIKELSEYFKLKGSLNCEMILYEDFVKDLRSRPKNLKTPVTITEIKYIDDFVNSYFSYLRPDGTRKKRDFRYKYDMKDPQCANDNVYAIKLKDGSKVFIWRFWQVNELYILENYLKDKGHIIKEFKEIS